MHLLAPPLALVGLTFPTRKPASWPERLPPAEYARKQHITSRGPQLPTCISKHRQRLRLPSRYPSPSRPTCLHQQTPSTVTTLPRRRRPVTARHVPTLPGPRVVLWDTGARPAPTSVMPTSSVKTLTTTSRALTSRKLPHHHANLPWLRPSPSCHHCMPPRNRRNSNAGAAAVASLATPASPWTPSPSRLNPNAIEGTLSSIFSSH